MCRRCQRLVRAESFIDQLPLQSRRCCFKSLTQSHRWQPRGMQVRSVVWQPHCLSKVMNIDEPATCDQKSLKKTMLEFPNVAWPRILMKSL